MNENTEIWREVPGWPKYAVSNLGRVKRLTRGHGTRPGRILKPIAREDGYVRVSFYDEDGRPRLQYIHDLVAKCFIGTRPVGGDINHKNGIKADNRDLNLEYCTRGENMKHAFRIGLGVSHRGEKCHLAKLTEESVREIRRRAASERLCDLAEEFGVSRASIWHAVNRLTWAHVP